MAPSSGHLLVPTTVNAMKFAVSKTSSFIRARLSQASIAAAAEAVPVRATKHSLHPLATLRQSRSTRTRLFSTATKHLRETFPEAFSNAGKTSPHRALPQSATGRAISKSTLAPFSTTLRPSLVGGALPRTAGGYTLGGTGTRAFSSVPCSQAQVVQNVSAAIRAFCVQGFRPQYDGIDPATGRTQWSAVTQTQLDLAKKVELAAGSDVRGTTLEFRLSPTLTAFSFSNPAAATLADESVVAGLSADFAAARKTLLQVQADLQRLSTLGSLPIKSTSRDVIEVRFPGCDGESVARLCQELGVLRGVVREDEAWSCGRDVEMALLFPWAPSGPGSADEDRASVYFETVGYEVPFENYNQNGLSWESMMTARAACEPQSHFDASHVEDFVPSEHTPTSRRPDGSLEMFPVSDNEGMSFHEVEGSEIGSEEYNTGNVYSTGSRQPWSEMQPSPSVGASGYEGVEGIYRFLREIDAARR